MIINPIYNYVKNRSYGNTTYLYYKGDECIDMTGGWIKTYNESGGLSGSTGSFTKNADNMKCVASAGDTICECGGSTAYNIDDILDYSYALIHILHSYGQQYLSTTLDSWCIVLSSLTSGPVANNQEYITSVQPMGLENINQGLALYSISQSLTYKQLGVWGYVQGDWVQFDCVALVKQDDISGLSNYGSDIPTIMSNIEDVLQDEDALYILANSSGDLMWNCLMNDTFVEYLYSGTHKDLFLNNAVWTKSIELV